MSYNQIKIPPFAASNNDVVNCAFSIYQVADHFVNRFLASHSDGDASDFEKYVAAKVEAKYHAFFDADDIITAKEFKEAVAYIIHEDCDALLEMYRDEDEALNA